MEARVSAVAGGNGKTSATPANSGTGRMELPLRELGHSGQAKLIVASLLSLALVSYIDWLTGYECLFFVFYFVPVALCAWRLGRTATVFMAGLAGVSWVVIDWFSQHSYSHEWVRYWNGFTCFMAFAILGIIMHGWQRSLQKQRRSSEELARALDEASRANEEIRKLQDQMQVVCAWTKRIRIDGAWIPIDEFLTRRLRVHFTHGISPEAYEDLKKSLQ